MKPRIPKPVRILVCTLVVFIFVFQQTACSKAPQSTASPNPQAEAVTITFSGNEFDQSLYQPLIAEFHKENPSISVQFVVLPKSSTGYATTSEYYRAQASAADTAIIGGSGAEMGAYFLDLGPQIEADAAFQPGDFWPGALAACQDGDGHTLGAPVTIILTGIYYDEQAFAASGLETPKPGWTWDDFRQDATTLAKQTGDAARYGYADQPYAAFNSILVPFLNANLAENKGEIDPQGLALAAGWYLDMARARVLYPLTGTDLDPQARDAWTVLFNSEENRPTMWAGNLASPALGNDATGAFALSQFGFAPFPVAGEDPNSKSTPLLANCVVVSKGSAHPAAGWTWVNFLTHHWMIQNKSQLNELVQMPARPSVADAEGLWTSLPEKAKATVRFGLEHGSYLNLYYPIESAIAGVFEQAARNQADLTTLLEEEKSSLAVSALPTPKGTPLATASLAVATPVTTPTASENAAQIRFYLDALPGEMDALNPLVEQFNRVHPNIVVQVSTRYKADQNEGLFQSLAGQFDCFVSQNDPANALSQVLNLNPFMENEDASFQQDYDPSWLQASQNQGQLLDLPLVTQPVVIAYNADLLARRGLQPPSLEWTFDDFLNLIQAATSTTEGDQTYGLLPDSQLVRPVDLLLAGRGANWLDTSGEFPVVTLNTPEMASTLTWLADLYHSGVLFQSSPGQDWWPSITGAVTSGQVAFWTALAGEPDGGYYSNAEKLPFKVGIAALPVIPAGAGSFQESFDKGMYISSQAKAPQACWTWMKFLSEQPAVFQGVLARHSVAASPQWETTVGPEAAAIYRAAAAHVTRSGNFSISLNERYLQLPLGTWEGQAKSGAMQGNDPAPLLVDAQRKADAYLACMQGVNLATIAKTDLQAKVMACAKQVRS